MFVREIRDLRLRDALELYLAYLEATGREQVTLHAYRRVCVPFIDLPSSPRTTAAITDDHLVLWLQSLRKRDLRDGTIAFHQRHLYAWLRWLRKRGNAQPDILMAVPQLIVENPRRRVLEPATYARLLTTLVNGRTMTNGQAILLENQRRDIAILRLLWATGIRRKELVMLRFGDVDLKGRELIVQHGKGHKSRRLPFDSPAKAALLEYIIQERRPKAPSVWQDTGPLFLARGGKALTLNGFDQMLKRLSDRAGVFVSAHDFRRAFAVRMRREGLDLGHLRTLLGHETLAMSLIYSATGEEEAAISAYRRIATT